MKPIFPHDLTDKANGILGQPRDGPSKRQRRMYHHRLKHGGISSTILLSSWRRGVYLLDWFFPQFLTVADLFLLSRSLRLLLLHPPIASICNLFGQHGFKSIWIANAFL